MEVKGCIFSVEGSMTEEEQSPAVNSTNNRVRVWRLSMFYLSALFNSRVITAVT